MIDKRNGIKKFFQLNNTTIKRLRPNNHDVMSR